MERTPKAKEATKAREKPRGFLQGLFEGVGRFFGGIGEAVKKVAHGLGGGLVLGVSKAADIYGTITGQQSAPRKLTGRERELLGGVYGGGLDLDKVRVVRGGPNTISLPPEPAIPRGVGNTIYWPTEGPYAALMDEGGIRLDNKLARETFVHEAAHTNQFQHGGPGYLADSLLNQASALLAGEGRNAAYEWEDPAARGVPWEGLNSEEQAHLIEEAYAAGIIDDDNKKLIRNGQDFTAYALAAVDKARRGVGWAS